MSFLFFSHANKVRMAAISKIVRFLSKSDFRRAVFVLSYIHFNFSFAWAICFELILVAFLIENLAALNCIGQKSKDICDPSRCLHVGNSNMATNPASPTWQLIQWVQHGNQSCHPGNIGGTTGHNSYSHKKRRLTKALWKEEIEQDCRL